VVSADAGSAPVHVIFTGGTISMQRDERAGGNIPTHGGETLVGFAPGIRDVAPIVVDDWGRYPACHMDQAKLWELRDHVRDVALGRPRGIVITHGTDTIEETAYLLSRTLAPDVAVVITGAMRTSSDAAWDGPRNLTDAVRVAAAPESRGLGTLVAFGGKIFSGHEAVKTHATRLGAFSAPHGHEVGAVSEQGVRLASPIPRNLRPPLDPGGLGARVALIPVITGDQGELLDMARSSSDGLVLMAYGSGNLPPGMVPAIRRWLDDGKPVVLASRCAEGEVTPVYAFAGGGATLVKLGVIPAGARTASQARMELVICLSAGVPFGT
jgi:L-asparaginase